MAEDVFRLFDEFAARFARGERPDVREYLARARGGADELARLVDRFLAAAPAPEPDDDAVAMLEAWIEGEPPLLELRRRRGLRRAAVVEALVERLGLDRAKREKVAGYYHQLETGLLDPGRVDRRVLAALAETLRARGEDLLAWPGRLPAAEPAYRRVPEAAPAPPRSPPAARPEDWDEVDELFLGERPNAT